MSHSKPEVYLHYVWAMWQREPIVTAEWENRIHGCIRGEIERLDCEVLAIGGMPDHVHVVVKLNPKEPIAKLAKQAKAVTSRMVNAHRPDADFFKWQRGYGVFSLSGPHVDRAIAYVNNQKRRHADNKIWPAWEFSGNDGDETSDE